VGAHLGNLDDESVEAIAFLISLMVRSLSRLAIGVISDDSAGDDFFVSTFTASGLRLSAFFCPLDLPPAVSLGIFVSGLVLRTAWRESTSGR